MALFNLTVRPPGAEALEEPSSEDKSSFWKKPFALWVIFGGLVYFGLGFLALILPFVASSPAALGDPFVLTFLVFTVIVFLAAFVSLSGKRWALVASSVVSILFLVLLGSFFLGPVLANPADPTFWFAVSGIPALVLSAVFSLLALFGPFFAPSFANPADPTFWLAISGIPALILAAVFSILSLVNLKKGLDRKRYLASHESPGGPRGREIRFPLDALLPVDEG